MVEARGRQRKLWLTDGETQRAQRVQAAQAEKGHFFSADLPLVPPAPCPQVLFLHPAPHSVPPNLPSLLLLSPHLLHLQPLPSLAPLRAAARTAPPGRAPGTGIWRMWGMWNRQGNKCSQGRSEARQKRAGGGPCQGLILGGLPYSRPSVPPSSTGPCSHARHRPAVGPLSSWPHWLLRAVGSPVSVLSSLFLN